MKGNETPLIGNPEMEKQQVQVLLSAPSFPGQTRDTRANCTQFAQNNARTADRRVRFPAPIKHRGSKVKIFAPARNFA